MGAFLLNAWYVAAWSHELGDALIARTLLEKPVLLYRGTGGAPVALADRCPHRFAPLHKGKRIGDAVQCPYHGLEFGPDGRCTRNPHGDGAIPREAQVETYPLVERDTDYYLENITKITSIEDFLEDDRLYRYAMKAHGLEDMIYAKAFMKKALTEGISDSGSFANKLTDKRYADFVASFNFEARGAAATTYVKARDSTVSNFAVQAKLVGVDPESAAAKAETAYFKANIGSIKSIDDFLKNDRLFSYAMKAFGLTESLGDKMLMRDILEDGVSDENSIANKMDDARYKAFAATFDFAALGDKTTTYNASQQPVVDKYLRQTLEENAGQENEGVRLALYFERKAPGINSFYDVLADTALAKVVRTALGLPDSFATADIDRQVKLMQSKIDIEDFKDPEALSKFMTRFTSMWEIENQTSPQATAMTVLFSQPMEMGVSTDLMMAMQKLKS